MSAIGIFQHFQMKLETLETHSQPCETSKVEGFPKTVND